MTDTTPTRDVASRQSELQELRRDIRQKQSYVRDDRDLWVQSNRWVVQSYDQPVGSIWALVRSTLAGLKEDPDHELYDNPNVDNPEDAFPDQCKGCPHYGEACAWVRQPAKGSLDRAFDEAATDDAFQARVYALANDHHCHVLRKKLDEWGTDYEAFVSQGEQIRLYLEANVAEMDVSDVDFHAPVDLSQLGPMPTREEAPAPFQTEPPEEVKRRREELKAELMGDDDQGERAHAGGD